jgi:hypothetical protein
MAKSRSKIKADDEEIDYDAIPEHLEQKNTETEVKHYIEGKKQTRRNNGKTRSIRK